MRATATRARAMPRVLAIVMPQARKADHLRLRTSSVRVGGLVQGGARQLVAAATDAALHIGLAGLVPLGCQTEVRTNVA